MSLCKRCFSEDAEVGHEYCPACEEQLEDDASAKEAAEFLEGEMLKNGEVGEGFCKRVEDGNV